MNIIVQRLWLNNGKVVSFVQPDRYNLHASTEGGGSHYFAGSNARSYVIAAWKLAGISWSKRLVSFSDLTWHSSEYDVTAKFEFYKDYCEEYGIDGIEIRKYYLSLSRPIQTIPGALDEDGLRTEEFDTFLLHKLWDIGLIGESDYVGPGESFSTIHIRITGKRVIVKNCTMLNV